MILATLIRPARTAQHSRPIALPRAFCVHLLSAVLGSLGIFAILAWADSDPHRGHSFSNRLLDLADDLLDEFARHPATSTLVTVLVGQLVEFGFVGLALTLMPWGARNERIRDSFRHALIWIWLHTPRIVLAVWVTGALLAQIDRNQRQWWHTQSLPSWPSPPNQPVLAPNDPNIAKAQSDYQIAITEYQVTVREIQAMWQSATRNKPWYLRHRDEIGLCICTLAGIWILWGLLATIGVRREDPPITGPPRCDECGYDLTMMPINGRCPECGLAIALSLGDPARPGCAWQHRQVLGFWKSWWKCLVDVVLRPVAFARQLRLHPKDSDHRRFLMLHIPAIALSSIVVTSVGFLTSSWFDADDVRELLYAYLLVGPFSATLAILLTCGVATLVGLWHRIRFGRNLMSGAVQLASYLSGYLAAVILFSGLTFIAILKMRFQSVFLLLDRLLGTENAGPAALVLIWTVVNAILGARYLVAIFRGTAAMRYANR